MYVPRARRRPPEGGYPSAFDGFWTAYPRNRNVRTWPKASTYAAWHAEIVDGATVEQLESAAAAYAASEDAARGIVWRPDRWLSEQMWREVLGPESASAVTAESLAQDLGVHAPDHPIHHPIHAEVRERLHDWLAHAIHDAEARGYRGGKLRGHVGRQAMAHLRRMGITPPNAESLELRFEQLEHA